MAHHGGITGALSDVLQFSYRLCMCTQISSGTGAVSGIYICLVISVCT